MGYDTADEAYEYLRELYNEDIVLKQKEKQKENQKERQMQISKKYYVDNVEVVNNEMNLYEVTKKLMGKSIVITIYTEKGGNIITTRYEEIPAGEKAFINWWKEKGVWIIWKTSDETLYTDYPDAVIYIYEGGKKINPEKIKQFFKEGNVNCLLKPIFSWAEECKEQSKSSSAKSRYNAIITRLKKISDQVGNNGVSEKEMLMISNDAQVDISIEKPIIVGNEKYVVETKANKKALKHFIMRNTKFNHVDQNELLYLNNIAIVSREELYNIKIQLEKEGT
jgi:hypothetical protein